MNHKSSILTLFSNPKPFHGDIGIIQRNALQSWAMLKPACDIILFGDEEGTSEIASKFDFRHVPDVSRNQYGTPLINDIFHTAQQLASSDLLCYINADIILMSDFMLAVERIIGVMNKFVMIGQRWDIKIDYLMDFKHPEWEQELLSTLKKVGKLHKPTGIDYLIFTHGLFTEIPPFAIGRALWDNWMVYHARSLRLPVVDASKQIKAVHQNHNYMHLNGGEIEAWQGPEAKDNLEMASGYDHAFTIADSTHIMTQSKVKKDLRVRQLLRHFISYPFLIRNSNPFTKLLRIIVKIPRGRYIVS